MPSWGNKRDKYPVNRGDLRTLIAVYQPAKSVDDSGGIIRFPQGAGLITAAALGTPLWWDSVGMVPYGVQQRADLSRATVEVWSTVTASYDPNKPYASGMAIQINQTGQILLIDGVIIITQQNNRFELTCRTVA